MTQEQVLDVGTKKTKKRIAGIDQDELVEPRLLADPDSCFCEFKGVHIHHKIYDVESQLNTVLQNQTVSQVSHKTQKIGLPMILLHGFGASVFSWKQVMKHLAEVAGSKVIAFDRPAFGLTSRVSGHISSGKDGTKPLNPYSMAFSVLATLYFIDQLAADKAILVGHSAGSLVAVNTYFEAPERVAALILIAPAIVAPFTTPKTVKDNQTRKDNEMKEGNSSAIRKNPFLGFYNILSKITRYIVKAITQMMKGMMDMLNSIYRKLLSAILRSALGIMLVLSFSVANIRVGLSYFVTFLVHSLFKLIIIRRLHQGFVATTYTDHMKAIPIMRNFHAIPFMALSVNLNYSMIHEKNLVGLIVCQII